MKFIKKLGILNVIFSAIIIILGIFLFRKSEGNLSISWMVIFDLSDFHNLHDLWVYILNLRTGIPPLLSIFEIILWLITKNPSLPLITIWIYRGSIILSYVLAVVLFNKSTYLKVLSFVSSLCFLYATAIIHKGNPAVYDVIFPFLILFYFALLDKSIQLHMKNHQTASVIMVVCSAIVLSNIELMRPFALIFIPFAILSVILIAKKQLKPNLKYLLAFIIPILLISGVWHLKLLIFNGGQVLWSNHGGYNMSRLWSEYTGTPPLQMEADPIKDGRWSNSNTQIHYENSKTFTKHITQYVVENPFESIKVVFQELLVYISAPIRLIFNESTSRLLSFYPVFVLLSFIHLFYQFFFNLLPNIFSKKSAFSDSNNILIIFTIIFLGVLCIGEKGEEARFLISMLPLLATFPSSPIQTLEPKTNGVG